jgi:sortase A
MRVRIAQSGTTPIDLPSGFAAKTGSDTRVAYRRLLRWSRNAFLAIGIVVLGYAGSTLVGTNLYQASQARRFQKQLGEIRPASASAGKIAVLGAATLRDGALGKIEIARLGVSAMIMEGVDERTLKLAVGHVPGTPLPGRQGNVAIAGHRDTFFRALRNIRQGDEITVMTLEGSYRYRVDSTQVVRPDDMRVLDDSDDSILTLVTCYPFYFIGPSPKRFIVRAHKALG